MTTRKEMIEKQLKRRQITDDKVLRAMDTVNRSLFVPEDLQHRTYDDGPLPIGEGQTISQPFIVAYMAQALELDPQDKVLEVGSGCGYNAAVLSRIASEVYSIEIIKWLAELAAKNIAKTGYKNIQLRYGDGYSGWPEKAPFDAIVLTAAPPSIPEPLKQQLKIGGRLIAPVGEDAQKLIRIKRTGEDQFEETTLIDVRFVPMTGKAQR